jgi:hypothetical protein
MKDLRALWCLLKELSGGIALGSLLFVNGYSVFEIA